MKNLQRPSGMPAHKYTPYQQNFPFDMSDRTWPDTVSYTHLTLPTILLV